MLQNAVDLLACNKTSVIILDKRDFSIDFDINNVLSKREDVSY